MGKSLIALAALAAAGCAMPLADARPYSMGRPLPGPKPPKATPPRQQAMRRNAGRGR